MNNMNSQSEQSQPDSPRSDSSQPDSPQSDSLQSDSSQSEPSTGGNSRAEDSNTNGDFGVDNAQGDGQVNMNPVTQNSENTQGFPKNTRSTFTPPASFIPPAENNVQPFTHEPARRRTYQHGQMDAFGNVDQQSGHYIPEPSTQNTPQYQAWAPYSGAQYTGAPNSGAPYSNAPYPTPAKKTKKRRTGLVITSTALIAVLLGGAAGYGGAWLYSSQNPNQSQTIQGQSNITINSPEDANLVTAVAAIGAPSVVSLSVSAGRASGTGSGVIISEDGYVITNNHVVTFDGVRSTPTISVKSSTGTLYSATIVATDPVMDLAVIKLDNASGLKPITFADSDELNVGDVAIAIGSPLGLEGTVTQGIISALNRSINVAEPAVPEDDETEEENGDGFNFWNNTPELQAPGSSNASIISLPVIQTDASINPGNSGGALLNSAGELIGINVAIATTSMNQDTAGSIGVGFSIPANLAKRVAEELIANQQASHGLLGATIRDAVLADSTPAVAGAFVVSVTPDGAANSIGITEGDIVTRFNGKTINGSTDLTAQVRYLSAGSEADLVYVRDGTQYTVSVTLGEMAR